MSEHDALIWIENHVCFLMIDVKKMILVYMGKRYISSHPDKGVRIIEVVEMAKKADEV